MTALLVVLYFVVGIIVVVIASKVDDEFIPDYSDWDAGFAFIVCTVIWPIVVIGGIITGIGYIVREKL